MRTAGRETIWRCEYRRVCHFGPAEAVEPHQALFPAPRRVTACPMHRMSGEIRSRHALPGQKPHAASTPRKRARTQSPSRRGDRHRATAQRSLAPVPPYLLYIHPRPWLPHWQDGRAPIATVAIMARRSRARAAAFLVLVVAREAESVAYEVLGQVIHVCFVAFCSPLGAPCEPVVFVDLRLGH